MAFLHSDVLCPYCLHELRPGDVTLSCPLCGSEAVQTRTEQMLHKSPRCKNKACHNHPATTRTCTFCGSTLPTDLFDYVRYLRFSVLGITGAGKSNFLTTMLHELRNTAGIPWVLSPMDSATMLRFQEHDQAVYKRQEPVPQTIPGAPPEPQQWKVKDKNKMSGTRIPTYSLTIFDGAGEDCEHIDPAISRYINGSRTLFILIDPLALPGIAANISEEILSRSTTAEHHRSASADMVEGLANYIRSSCGISPGKLIDRDVAVVFTKIDAVRESFGTATVMNPSPHLRMGGFVKADADAVDAEIRDWLERAGETIFLNAIDTNFRRGKVRFFGVSSFGHPPTGIGQLGKVIPHRVLDPMLWMLSKENIVPVI